MHLGISSRLIGCGLPRLARLNEVATPLTKGEAAVKFKNCLHIATRVDLYTESHGYTWWKSMTNCFSMRQYTPSYYTGGTCFFQELQPLARLGQLLKASGRLSLKLLITQ